MTDQSMADDEQVRAAGGVVWRGLDEQVEVAVVHRPRYDDWSLPKGKLDGGESFAGAALREITEETGIDGTLGPELGTVRYTDHKGRSKVVRWWAVQARSGAEGEPQDPQEVDEVRWLPPGEAVRLVTYDTDREVLGWFEATLAR